MAAEKDTNIFKRILMSTSDQFVHNWYMITSALKFSHQALEFTAIRST